MNDQIYKNWRKDVGTDYETTRKLVDEDYTRANISRNTENELVKMNEKLTGATTMNQRIQELYKQAWGHFPCPTGEPELEKFAELLINECIGVVNKRYMGDNNREDFEVRRCVEDLKKHFGVE